MHSVVTTFNANMSDNIGAKLDVDVLSATLNLLIMMMALVYHH